MHGLLPLLQSTWCCTLQSRKKITQRGASLGVDFVAEVNKLRAAANWEAELEVSSQHCLLICTFIIVKAQANFDCRQPGILICSCQLTTSPPFMPISKVICAGKQPGR